MDRTLDVRTPESIEFRYELAGLGSRFLAVTVDFIIQLLVVTGIFWGIIAIGASAPVRHAAASAVDKTATSVGIAIIAFILFAVFFGYFILFETFWNGQTPGKKLLQLRVVRDGGYPIDFGSSAIRNLIRVGELTLTLYAISAVSALISSQNKRLGDIAAGTIVVREAAGSPLESIVQASGGGSIGMLSMQERSLIERFVARRRALDSSHRRSMAAELAARVRPRVSRDLQGLDDEELLERLSAL